MHTRLVRLVLCAALGLAAAGLLPPAPALGAGVISPAAPIIVNSADDVPDVHPGDGVCETGLHNGFCTLRGAIQEANARPGRDTIQLQANTTYQLDRAGTDDTALNGDLDITDSVTLLGAGPLSTIIDGNAAVTGDRVFQITGTVTISGVTVQNGIGLGGGGGIVNHGRLSLINSHVISNTTTADFSWGGGIESDGPLTISDSLISGNTTVGQSGEGGGIESDGPLTISDSLILGNTATGDASEGGGLASFQGLLLINSTVSGNTTAGTFGNGGGSFSSGASRIVNSLISGNSSYAGGGIYNAAGQLNVINSTISGNDSTGDGGGLFATGGASSLFNVTVTANHADFDFNGSGVGGGLANGPSSALSIANSIVARNATIVSVDFSPELNYDDCSGTISAQGRNLLYVIDAAYCTVTGAHTTADPLLGPLADNGGPTLTHALLPGSPAINAGNPSGCTDNLGAPITTDQRGYWRPSPGQGACDIGAFEVGYRLALPLLRR